MMLRALLMVVIGFAMWSPARATVWTGSAPVAIGGVDPGWLSFSIPGFDPRNGTVLSAKVTLDGTLQASVSGAASGTLFDNAIAFASAPGSIALGSMPALATSSSVLGERVTVSATSALAPGYVQTAQAGALDVGVFFSTLLAGSGAGSQTVSFNGWATASVTYATPVTFAAFSIRQAAPAVVPEPATMALLGVGLLWAGLWTRGRR